MIRRTNVWFSLACFAILSTLLGTAANGQEPGSVRLDPLDLKDVKVGGEVGRRINLTLKEYILAVDVDKVFLDPIRKKASSGARGGASGYLGFGKFIDATVHLAAHTRDKRLIAFKNRLVSETLKTQLDDGYVGTMQPAARIRQYWDVHEMVYIIHALVSDYRLFNNRAALRGAAKAADYIMAKRPPGGHPRSTGKLNLERALLGVSAATGERKYRDYVLKEIDFRKWAAAPRGHAYTFMNVCLAQLDFHKTEPSPKLLVSSHNVIDFLTRQDGLLIHGSCSRGEAFHSNQDGTGDAAEACATAYLIKLLDRLLQLEGKALYGDMLERAIYNALFAAQSPDGKQTRYFTAVEGRRKYFKERRPNLPQHTYCCPNNFRRAIADLPGLICYRTNDDGLLINLYTASSATLKLKGATVKLRQETDYPTSGKVLIHLAPDKAVDFPLRLRIPRWCDKAKVSVNGRATGAALKGGQFLKLKRRWKAGDRVELDMPMPWRLVRGRKAQQGRAAVMRGPMLFCLSPARQADRYPIFGGRRQKRGEALAKLRERLGKNAAALGVLDRVPVDLADIVAGGHGFGSGRVGHGINPLDGKPTTGSAPYITCKPNVFLPVASKFIDGVVVPDGGKDGKAAVPVTSTGIKLTGLTDTSAKTWDFFKHGPGLSQKGFKVGDVDYRVKGHSMLAIHANKIITFDLAAIRKGTGYGVLRFRSRVGYGGIAKEATVDFSVYVDGKSAVKNTRITRAGVPLDLPIGPTKRFLTLVVTDADNDISHDQIFFGDPHLVPEPPGRKSDAEKEQRRRLLAEQADLKKQMAAFLPVAEVLKGLRVDLKSLEGPVKDDTVRPGGVACRVRAWSPGRHPKQPADLVLLLTEFADPGGEMTYFPITDASVRTVDDELIQTGKQ